MGFLGQRKVQTFLKLMFLSATLFMVFKGTVSDICLYGNI